MNDDGTKLFFIIMICLLLIAILVLAFRPDVVINNYISSGNYTFDIGQNMVEVMNKSMIQ